MLRSTNPWTGASRDVCEAMDRAGVEKAIGLADEAQRAWARRPVDERTRLLLSLRDRLMADPDGHARLMAEEMGKPVRDGRKEAEKCARLCAWYAEHAAGFLADEPIEMDEARAFVAYRPLGLVLAVMPWNFPYWQVFRCAVPALAAGNGVLLKHAANVTECALAMETLFREAGFPEHLFRALPIETDLVAAVLEDSRVRAASLTGSTAAGRAVAAKAGEQLKKTVLELGGSDPYVVLEDAPLDATAAICAKSRMVNGGQSCIAAKRFVVVEPVREEFERLLVTALRAWTPGDPLLEKTILGPMARHDLRDELHGQVERSIDAGARCLLGGAVPEGPSASYPPTVLTDVKPGMPAYDEEMFGPVAAVIAAKDEKDAVRIANDSPFGLGAAVFTADAERGERIARDELDAGCCFVNDFVRSDPRLPFGGIKESGYGRELGAFGIREFTNIKTVYRSI